MTILTLDMLEYELVVTTKGVDYGDWHIYYEPVPGPGNAWHYYHDDYDGAPDGNDHRCGTCNTFVECIIEINEEHEDA